MAEKEDEGRPKSEGEEKEARKQGRVQRARRAVRIGYELSKKG